jgi:OOP family OmpA-OmpF porin
VVTKYLKILFIVVLANFVLISCASEPRKPLKPPLYTYMSKDVENVFILFDASRSMLTWQNDETRTKRFDIAKHTLTRMNRIMTCSNLSFKAGLRVLSHEECIGEKKTALVYGISDFSEPGLQDGIEQVKCAEGITYMKHALDAVHEDLKPTSGKIALIIISDGRPEFFDRDPMPAVEKLKKTYGARLAIHTIALGEEPEGRAIMDKIASIGQGSSVGFEDIKDMKGVLNFVENALGDDISDSDDDGAPDCIDKCPNTRRDCKIDDNGCPIDSDADGVPDCLDDCPDTPRGTRVNAQGCPFTEEKFVIQFNLDSDIIREDQKPLLDLAATLLLENPDINVTIEGHTCNLGTEEYNLDLSQRRAESAKAYLMSRGVAGSRMTTIGKGELYPIASNATEETRKLNRRIEFVVKN